MIREWYHAECDANDSHYIDELDDDKSERDIPCLMFPWSRKNQHKEKPVKPLFQTGAFWCYGDVRVSVVAVHHADDVIMSDDVDSEDMFKYPAALVE